MISKNKILIAMQISMLAWSGYTFAADRVYVANEGADSVNVLDAVSLKTVDKVHVGKCRITFRCHQTIKQFG